MGWPIDMERKGCESIGCYTHFLFFNIPLTHDLDLGFSRSNFEKVISQEWDGHSAESAPTDHSRDECGSERIPRTRHAAEQRVEFRELTWN